MKNLAEDCLVFVIPNRCSWRQPVVAAADFLEHLPFNHDVEQMARQSRADIPAHVPTGQLVHQRYTLNQPAFNRRKLIRSQHGRIRDIKGTICFQICDIFERDCDALSLGFPLYLIEHEWNAGNYCDIPGDIQPCVRNESVCLRL